MSEASVEVEAGLAALLAPSAETRHAGDDRPDPVPETAQQASAPDPERADAEPQPEPETVTPASLKDLAAKAGLDLTQLYALELPGLEGLTLGQVKDRAQELRDVDATREALETERAANRQARLTWARELSAAQAAGLHAYTEPERAHIGQLLGRHAAAEAETIMAAVPEWANQATLKADFEGMAALLKPYGFSPTDVAQQLEGDARFTLFMKDQLDRSRRLKAAEAKVKAPPKKLLPPAGSIAQADALQRIYNDPKSSPIDKGLAALLQGARK